MSTANIIKKKSQICVSESWTFILMYLLD